MELVREIGACVSKTFLALEAKLKLWLPNIQSIHYEYGHLIEIQNTLAEWAKSDTYRYENYPVVCLLRPFGQAQSRGADFDTAKVTIIIANTTTPTYKSAQRQVENFEPILIPIYEELLRQIANSPAVIALSTRDLPHTRFDHDYWGRQSANGNTANKFGDYVDAIEVRDLQITLSNNSCF